MFGFEWHSHGHQLFGRLFLQGLSHFPPLWELHAGFLVFCMTFQKLTLTEFCILCWLYWLAWLGAHHTMPVVSLLFLRTVLCSPWKKMFLESSCTESSTSGHFEDLETSIHRLNEKYILCWFLSLQACELEDTWLVAAAMVKFCSCISFFNCPYHYAVKLLQDWEWERKRADCKQVPTRNFNLVLSICFSVDIYCLETGYSHLSRRFASWAVK